LLIVTLSIVMSYANRSVKNPCQRFP
jgi:hypothetical protein